MQGFAKMQGYVLSMIILDLILDIFGTGTLVSGVIGFIASSMLQKGRPQEDADAEEEDVYKKEEEEDVYKTRPESSEFFYVGEYDLSDWNANAPYNNLKNRTRSVSL